MAKQILYGQDARHALERGIDQLADTVKITVTSDAAQTIKLSVYGGDVQAVDFAEGETKTVTFER